MSANAVSAEGMIVDVFAFCVFYHFIPTVTLSCTNKDKTLGWWWLDKIAIIIISSGNDNNYEQFISVALVLHYTFNNS